MCTYAQAALYQQLLIDIMGKAQTKTNPTTISLHLWSYELEYNPTKYVPVAQDHHLTITITININHNHLNKLLIIIFNTNPNYPNPSINQYNTNLPILSIQTFNYLFIYQNYVPSISITRLPCDNQYIHLTKFPFICIHSLLQIIFNKFLIHWSILPSPLSPSDDAFDWISRQFGDAPNCSTDWADNLVTTAWSDWLCAKSRFSQGNIKQITILSPSSCLF